MLVSSWCKHQQALKGCDQPQLEPPLTPLSIGPGAVFKLSFGFQWHGQHCWRGAGLDQGWSHLPLATELLDLGLDLQTSPGTAAVLWTHLAILELILVCGASSHYAVVINLY